MFLHLSKYSNSKSLTFFGSCYVFTHLPIDAERERGSYMRRTKLYCSWPSTKMKSIELMVLDNFCCNLWNLLRSDSAISYFSSVHCTMAGTSGSACFVDVNQDGKLRQCLFLCMRCIVMIML